MCSSPFLITMIAWHDFSESRLQSLGRWEGRAHSKLKCCIVRNPGNWKGKLSEFSVQEIVQLGAYTFLCVPRSILISRKKKYFPHLSIHKLDFNSLYSIERTTYISNAYISIIFEKRHFLFFLLNSELHRLFAHI